MRITRVSTFRGEHQRNQSVCMGKVIGYIFCALIMIFCAYYSISSFHNIAQEFIYMATAGAEQTRDLLASEDNIINSITAEQRSIWLSNLSDPSLEATGIIVIRDLASYAIGILSLGYIGQFLIGAYKSYNKAKQV